MSKPLTSKALDFAQILLLSTMLLLLLLLAPPCLGPVLYFFFPFAVKVTFSSSSLLLEELPCTKPLWVSSYTKSSHSLSQEGKFSLATIASAKTTQGFATPFTVICTSSVPEETSPTIASSFLTLDILVR